MENIREYFPKRSCIILKKHFVNPFGDNMPVEEYRETLYRNLSNALCCYDCMKNGSGNYQYGSLYLTTDVKKAGRYAFSSYAFGEIGLITFRMLEALLALGTGKIGPYAWQEFAKPVLDFALDPNPRPVVYRIENLTEDSLLLENGRSLRDIKFGDDVLFGDVVLEGSFRCLDDINLQSCKIVSREEYEDGHLGY
ncbi:MAG: hypothetical protein NC324_05920 [Bacteroides sp.]|nr:hypothetical protein [Bacteroides sp.]